MNTRRFLTLALGGALCLIAPSNLFAQSPETQEEADAGADIDAQLKALEAAAYDEEGADTAESAPANLNPVAAAVQSMNPDISFVLDMAGAWFSDEPDLRGGHDPTITGFNLQGLELAVRSDVGPYFRLDGAINFSLEGVEIEEAFATTLALPWQLQARAGQFKTNFGRLNPTHLHTWTFATQPLVNSKFLGAEGLRGLGVELSQLALWVPGTFRWYVSAQNISEHAHGDELGPDDAHGHNDELAHDDDTGDALKELTLAARIEEFVALSANWDLLLGLSYANGPNEVADTHGDDTYRTHIYGADTFLNWRSRTSGGQTGVGWQTEFMLRRRQMPAATLQDFGLSSWVEWRINRHWASAIRGEYVTAADSTAEASQPNLPDPLDPEWTEARQRGAFQLSYYPSHFSRLRLQYGLDHMPYREEHDKWVHQVMLQMEFVVGAHGAHTY